MQKTTAAKRKSVKVLTEISKLKFINRMFANTAIEMKKPNVLVGLISINKAVRTSIIPVTSEYRYDVPRVLQNKISLLRLPKLVYRILGSGE